MNRPPAPAFLSSIQSGTAHALRPTETKEKQLSVAEFQRTEPEVGKEDELTDYFFKSGLDKWYDQLENCTFNSDFVPLLPQEASVIINNWKRITNDGDTKEISSLPPTTLVPDQLEALITRIDASIQAHFNANTPAKGKVFIKLNTRSPKDSKTIFKKAVDKYRQEEQPSSLNDRLCLFSELMLKCSSVSSGREAVTIMLDSWRVAEDLMAAYDEDGNDLTYNVSIVVRGWDDRILPSCEFRGFVMNNTLTCIGQYWHHLFFPELEAIKEQVARDCLLLFENTLKESLPVPNAMLDLAWLGPGEVILIEVNPLAEGLGSFKGSTGLFDYEEEVIRGNAPFEIRLCTEEAKKHELQNLMNLEWRRILLVDHQGDRKVS